MLEEEAALLPRGGRVGLGPVGFPALIGSDGPSVRGKHGDRLGLVALVSGRGMVP